MASKSKHLVLTAMIFAVAMMFIDQTIVALAVPTLQRDLHLSSTGSQWAVNAYLLSLAAFFALGGRVADVVGRRRMVVIGVAGFAAFSALCGATPTGSYAEAWLIGFRVLQGASAAFLFPAALAIVVGTYPVRERGKALAIFYSISGGLTAVGPIAGGYLTQWTWRSIFWINVPIAVIAIALTVISKPSEERHPSRIDWSGALLVCAGMALAVLGLQQASVWGWSSPRTLGCLVAGLLLLGAFVRAELRGPEPLVPMRLFGDRGFRADVVVLFLISVCFVPLFFFASLYAQIALGDSATNAGLLLLVFFGGFSIASQKAGQILDSKGARPTALVGCAIAAIGFAEWGLHLQTLSFGSQWYYLALAGAGMGFVLGPISTDAVNRASRTAYGAVTGITQTVRNFAGSLGLAVLGSVLITELISRTQRTLTRAGVPHPEATRIAHSVASATAGAGSAGSHGSARPDALFHKIQMDFAYSTHIVVLAMAGVMALAFVVALVSLPRGRVEELGDELEPAATEPAAGKQALAYR